MVAFPPFVPLGVIRERLSSIFPESFPDRSILVGEMAARLVFVALYGGFVEGDGRFFRPSTVIRFSLSQAEKESDSERLFWVSQCQAAGYRAVNQWYADNTREPLRDDLIRNRAIPIGFIKKRDGVATTSPAPIYCLGKSFAGLFNPDLSNEELAQLVSDWQDTHLDPMVLQRMRLLRQTEFRTGDVPVALSEPKTTLRLAPGAASLIIRDVCESLLAKIMTAPVVVHISTSEQRAFKELSGLGESMGLTDLEAGDLPNIVAVDAGSDDGLRFVFIEVVHSDGAITELRKKKLMEVAETLGFPISKVRFVTAFEDRNASSFKKRVSEIARGTEVWFRSEPEIMLRLVDL